MQRGTHFDALSVRSDVTSEIYYHLFFGAVTLAVLCSFDPGT